MHELWKFHRFYLRFLLNPSLMIFQVVYHDFEGLFYLHDVDNSHILRSILWSRIAANDSSVLSTKVVRGSILRDVCSAAMPVTILSIPMRSGLTLHIVVEIVMVGQSWQGGIIHGQDIPAIGQY